MNLEDSNENEKFNNDNSLSLKEKIYLLLLSIQDHTNISSNDEVLETMDSTWHKRSEVSVILSLLQTKEGSGQEILSSTMDEDKDDEYINVGNQEEVTQCHDENEWGLVNDH